MLMVFHVAEHLVKRRRGAIRARGTVRHSKATCSLTRELDLIELVGDRRPSHLLEVVCLDWGAS